MVGLQSLPFPVSGNYLRRTENCYYCAVELKVYITFLSMFFGARNILLESVAFRFS